MAEFKESNPTGRLDDASEKDSGEKNQKSAPKGLKSPAEEALATKKSRPKRKAKPEQVNLDEYNLGGLKYKLPGKRQRVILGSVVLGLNLVLAVVAVLYFTNPNFQEFIFTVGRG